MVSAIREDILKSIVDTIPAKRLTDQEIAELVWNLDLTKLSISTEQLYLLMVRLWMD